MDAHEISSLRDMIEGLRVEHRDLDLLIAQVLGCPPVNMLEVQRLKKRKLALKDHIARLENRLIPDIIA